MKFLVVGIVGVVCLNVTCRKLLAENDIITGSVRVQLLSSSLVRLEQKGPEGFEDCVTFHIKNRNWPGTSFTSNLVSGNVVITTADYNVYVPQDATSLAGAYVTSPTGQILYQYNGVLTNSVWLPGPSDNPTMMSFADTPRLIPPAWGLTPAPSGSPLASTSGWDTNNDAPDVYVFIPNGRYDQLRSDFLRLTGPTEMVPLYALGAWDSRWYDYSESTALAQIDAYRSRLIPLDVLVCDTGWRQGASTGYQPNTNLFPNLPRFFSEAHAKDVHVMFNDHPEPVASSALDPAEVIYRYTNLTQILGGGLDIWWYDRNWPVSLLSPAPNLRHEVWGMEVYHDATYATNAPLRPMIMANVDGIDSGIRNRPMDVAAHRYPIQWTGDIEPSMAYLDYAIENAVHSGVQSLFPYESDDLGGHVANPTTNGYIRWIEYGALSPIYRPHCTYNLTRMPWTFGPDAEWTARRLLNLRYRLLPVLYDAVHENYETGEPILRRLDLDYPQYPEASLENQYLISHSLVVAPEAEDVSSVPSSWLTTTNGLPGLNAEYFSNTNLTGTPTLTEIDPNINFNWNAGSPGGLVPSTNFTVQWTGNITVPATTGDVTLAALSDDGVRVWVNNQLWIDNWGPNDAITTESTNVLKAGQTYQLQVQYLQLGGNDLITLESQSVIPSRSIWIPPGNWINAWSGAVVKGPMSVVDSVPLEQIPLYIRSGSIFALAPQMQYTGQLPWDPITLDVYPSTTETDQTSLYEDDTLTTNYQQGQFRTTAISTWADDAAKTVSVSIAPAVGTFSGALTQRSWVVRLHRPPNWPADLAPVQVTLNGQSIGPIVRRVENTTAMPLGADNGAPDADVFEVTVPESSVLTSNLVVATFGSVSSPWICSDIGDVDANGNVLGGASTLSNSTWIVRGGGAGIGGTNDGFHFLYQPCVSNAELTVHLLSQQSGNLGAEAGIMISESLNPAARNVVVAMAPGNGAVFQSRSTTGSPAQTTNISGFPASCWLRLVRSGNSFFGYASADGVVWNQIGFATIPGFVSPAYIGLAVTDDILSTNNVDDTNYNEADFENLALNTSVSISTVPNQITPESTATPAIPFVIGSITGNALTVTAQSSNTNVLSVQNIVIGGSGANRFVTLSPTFGVSGSSTVTLTFSDGTNSASTQFTLTVFASSAVVPSGKILLNEDFSNYQAGNLPGQEFLGTGFVPGGLWVGLNSTFSGNVADAATVSYPNLTWQATSSAGGMVTMKGDGSNLEGFPDLSADSPFAVAGLYDAASDTIGGGNVSGTLYISFLIHAHFSTGNNAYGGLQLSRGDDTTGVLIGDSLPAWGYSLWYPQTSTSVDLDNMNGTGAYLYVDTNTHLMVAKITYIAGGPDTLTAWLDPNVEYDENDQSSSATYIGSMSGDFSFNRFFLSGGNANQFDYGDIRFGTSWSSVLPTVAPVALPPVVEGITTLPSNRISLSFSGPTGQPYSICATTNLALPLADWASISTGTFGFNSVTFSDLKATNFSQRFYLIAVP